ncbi:MAG: arginine decarboxylase, pyruvoyl-dependent [Phycisphaerae bacterium]|nr:arginine decarboxylase, pyruvoyl-dependent [Phycisphaerae bacterium]
MVPSRVFFTHGVGVHKHRLQSFELALRDAGIERFNLVRVSSIFPPHCKIISAVQGLSYLKAGQILHVVLAEASTDEPGRLVCAGLGLAKPARGDQHGYISEHHGFGLNNKKTGDLVEDMAATMLATTLGIEFDPETGYDTRKEVYRMSGKIVLTRNVVQTAEGNKYGLWTTVVAAAVFVP